MKLYHKLLPERVSDIALRSISERGLIPQMPSEYKKSLPSHLQKVPIVWLSEKMNTMDGAIFSVDTKMLNARKLHKLDWDDVNWWVYEGGIPSVAVEPLVKE